MTHSLPHCFLHSDDGGGLMERLWKIIREWDATEGDIKVFSMYKEKKRRSWRDCAYFSFRHILFMASNCEMKVMEGLERV